MAGCTAGIFAALVTPVLCKLCLLQPRAEPSRVSERLELPAETQQHKYTLKCALQFSLGNNGAISSFFLDVEDCLLLGAMPPLAQPVPTASEEIGGGNRRRARFYVRGPPNADE